MFTSGAFADTTIVSVSGTAASPFSVGGVGQVLAASWTSGHAYTNVSIGVEIGTGLFGSTPGGVDAYLTTAIGPSETAANVITSVADFTPNSTEEFDTIFSGLDLAAGTYYLVLSGDAGKPCVWWGPANAATKTTGDGDAVGSDYLALSSGNDPLTFSPIPSLDLFYQVTGTLVSTPEPATSALFGLTLAAILGRWLYLRRRVVLFSR